MDRPTRLFVNGEIITLDPFRPRARAMAVSGERIVFVGAEADVLSLRSRGTSIVDLEGKVVVPGFNDSHMHLFHWGKSIYGVDLTAARSCRDVVEAGRLYCQLRPGTGWVIGRGWNDTSFVDKGLPTRNILDEVSLERPVAFTRVCGHVWALNSRALHLAGIGPGTPDPPGGEIDRDPATGNPTGIVRESAIDLVSKVIPEPSAEEWKGIVSEAAQRAAAFGLTTVQSNDIDGAYCLEERLAAYRSMAESGRLPIRINLQVGMPTLGDLRAFVALRKDCPPVGEKLKLGPVKLFADGSLGARTAALFEDYSDDPGNRGIVIYPQDELNELVSEAGKAGLQVAVHAIGDRAMAVALSAFSRLSSVDRLRLRPRLIHCQIANQEVLQQMAEMGVVGDIQPVFMPTDCRFAERRVGSQRLQTSYAWRTMLKLGIPLAGGSDCPVETCDPLVGLHAAITRQDARGYPEGGWNASERLSPYEALRLFTCGSAYACREEHIKGTIWPGKLADFVVLSLNPLEAAPEELLTTKVLRTYVGGELVYEA